VLEVDKGDSTPVFVIRQADAGIFGKCALDVSSRPLQALVLTHERRREPPRSQPVGTTPVRGTALWRRIGAAMMRAMTLAISDVRDARSRIAGKVHRTPLLPLDGANTAVGAPSLFAKAENLQRTGSFKLRGAMNFLSAMDPAERVRGVVTHSSGNHGQALACAAAWFGVPATIVIPEGAPEVKVERTRAWGASILRSGQDGASRQAVAAEAVASTGGTLVPPFDHPWIVAGQGTMALEIAEDLPGVANVLVCVGGGGLSAGTVLALQAQAPGARVIGVEPALAADAMESLRKRQRVRWPAEATTRTIADGVRTQELGEIPFAILKEGLYGIVTVSEDAIVDAARWWLRDGGMAVEPTGALTLAAWRRFLAGRGSVDGVELADGPTVLVISGGNADPSFLGSLL